MRGPRSGSVGSKQLTRAILDTESLPLGLSSERCPLYPRKRTFVRATDTSALCQKRTPPWAEEACGLRDELNRVTIARSAQWGPDNPCRLGFLSAPRARKGCFWSAGVEYWFSTQPSTGKQVGE